MPYLGQISQFAFERAPSGWQLCDGSSLPIEGNESLFSLIGNTYGGDGVSEFRIPDCRPKGSDVPKDSSGNPDSLVGEYHSGFIYVPKYICISGDIPY